MIEVETTITLISTDGKVKPTAPSFKMVNDRGVFCFINNNFILRPQEEFTIDLMDMAAEFLEHGIELVNDTEFFLHFDTLFSGGVPTEIALIQQKIKK